MSLGVLAERGGGAVGAGAGEDDSADQFRIEPPAVERLGQGGGDVGHVDRHCGDGGLTAQLRPTPTGDAEGCDCEQVEGEATDEKPCVGAIVDRRRESKLCQRRGCHYATDPVGQADRDVRRHQCVVDLPPLDRSSLADPRPNLKTALPVRIRISNPSFADDDRRLGMGSS